MKVYLRVAVLALVLFATPAAQSPAFSQTEADEALTSARQWLSDSARWVELYNQVMAKRGETLLDLAAGRDAIEQRVTAGDVARAREEAARWTDERRESLARDRAALAALPPPPALNLAPALMNLPGTRESLVGPAAHLRNLSSKYAAYMDMTDRRAESYILSINAAIDSPDPEQAFNLAGLDLAGMMFDSESALIEASLPPEGVTRFVSLGTLHSNSAVSQWYGHLGDLWRGVEPDRAARATAIRGSATEIRLSAGRLVEAADEQQRILAANPALTSAAHQALLQRYHASFIGAAEIEGRIAEAVEQLAEALAAGDDDKARELIGRIAEIAAARREGQVERNGMLQQISSTAS